MEVLALLPPPLLAHLHTVLDAEHMVREASDVPTLAAAIRRLPVDVLLLDPSLVSAGEMEGLFALVSSHPTLPVVAYTSLAPSRMREVVELTRRGVQHVVLHRYDDAPSRLRELVERQGTSVLTETLLDLLAPGLAQMPAALTRAIERMLRQPQRFFTVEDLAREAGTTVRTVYRQCEGAGLVSPRLLVVGARVLRGYLFMRDPGHSVDDVAAKLGYSAPRIFARHMRLGLGTTPREARRLAPLEVLARLEALLVTEQARPVHAGAAR